MIRAFIALDLHQGVLRALAELQQEWQRTAAPVSWIKPESIHLTLKFLGNIANEQAAEIQALLLKVAAVNAPLRLQPMGCGAFPSIKQMRVVWVGLQGAVEELLKLQKSVEEALVPLGFAPEDRPYRAHLTLGRVKGRRHLQLLQEAVLRRQGFQTEAFDVTEVVLYRSELRPEGARYTALFRAPLGREAA
ncbi:MAG TPA: RNA 2',3'-cyclic phosphodiesterase [Syntrophobacteraceae bacterium]|nr:RNA 2',3'-cyclic phosphodiesterase [Syntrophobacteraceae bacterium]HBD10217.1 RNA 2',3'-cyclic phosphodiesterase [Syntrophobacteraceae bacterium]